MKRTILMLSISLLCSSAFAEQISEQQASQIAGKYLPVTTTSLKALRTNNTTSSSAEYYVFNAGNDNGYVIVSGDDELTELVGYSDNGSFKLDENMPENLKFWLGKYSEYVQAFRNGKIQSNKKNISKGSVIVAPLLKTKWGQMRPYNNLCPHDRQTRQNCPTGCVATAFAQVMKYWEWPVVGQGSHSYQNDYRTETVDFSKSVYDWGNMRNEYPVQIGGYEDFSKKEADAVAKLMYDCGVSIEMIYAGEESGAADTDVAMAAKTYFKYDAIYLPRNAFSSAEYLKILKDYLDNSCPLLYGGGGDGGGHEFVLDGYDSNNFMHVNWGWDGQADGYYNIDFMNPSELGTGGGSGGFCYEQSGIVLLPNKTNNATTNQNYLWLIPEGYMYQGYIKVYEPQISKGDILKARVAGIWNSGFEFYKGQVGVAVFDQEGNRLTTPVDVKDLQYDILDFTNSEIIFKLQTELKNLEDGIYYLRPVSKESRTDIACEWQRLVTMDYQAIEVKGNTITPILSDLYIEVAEPITASQDIINPKDTPTFTVTLSNPTNSLCEGYVNFEIMDAENTKLLSTSEYLILYDHNQYTFNIPMHLKGSFFKDKETYTFSVSESITARDSKFRVKNNSNNLYKFTLGESAGISELEAVANIRIFPNPTCDFVTVETEAEILSAQLYTIEGQLVKSIKDLNKIDLSDCAAGYYILSLNTTKGKVNKQIIKK